MRWVGKQRLVFNQNNKGKCPMLFSLGIFSIQNDAIRPVSWVIGMWLSATERARIETFEIWVEGIEKNGRRPAHGFKPPYSKIVYKALDKRPSFRITSDCA